MHGSLAMMASLVEPVIAEAACHAPAVQTVLCPPFTLLGSLAALVRPRGVKLGAQDCHSEAHGAFTGDISAPMLTEIGCSHVIVGHSERRQYHHETNQEICLKATAAIQAGLTPIICIGETEAEREGGQAFSVIERQVRESLPKAVQAQHFLLAYEPVWAIGSGKVPGGEDIQRMHRHIMEISAQHLGGESTHVRVLYGGSVKPANAVEILAMEVVAGVLVGGASLVAEGFIAIMRAAALSGRV